MNLGMRCGYAEECPVYRGETEVKDISLHLLRNVFCNRGNKGWKNCSRYSLLEKGAEVGKEIHPYSEI
jgi:hypothetical protein